MPQRLLRKKHPRKPRSPWRSPGLVDWSLYKHRERATAESELDDAFAKTVVWLRAQLLAGHPVHELLQESFDRIGPTMHRWADLGAVDTEPCANVSLALAAMASPPRQQKLRRVLH